MIKDFKIGDKVKYKRMDGNYAYGEVKCIGDNDVLVEIFPILSNAPYAMVTKDLLEFFEFVNIVESKDKIIDEKTKNCYKLCNIDDVIEKIRYDDSARRFGVCLLDAQDYIPIERCVEILKEACE